MSVLESPPRVLEGAPQGRWGARAGLRVQPPGPSRLARLVTSSCAQEADRQPIKPRLAKPWIAATTIFLYFDHSAQTLGEGEGKGRRRRKGGSELVEGEGCLETARKNSHHQF